MKNLKTVGAVRERERERESYNLTNIKKDKDETCLSEKTWYWSKNQLRKTNCIRDG